VAAIAAAGTSAVKNRTAMMVTSVCVHVVGLIRQRFSERTSRRDAAVPEDASYFGYSDSRGVRPAWFDLVPGWRRGVRLLGPKRQIPLSVEQVAAG
jgi:hypothetical protein